MSRHWSEYKYISSDALWAFVDEYAHGLDMLSENDSIESSELCKLLIMGRREALDAFIQQLHENEVFLETLVTDTHCVLTREELQKIKKEDYGL
jgi:hypothetical protein